MSRSAARAALLVVVAALVAATTTVAHGVGSAAASPMASDAPDPFLLEVGDTTYLFSTNNDEANVPVWRSDDGGATWEWAGDALPDLPDGAVADWGLVWAPAVGVTDVGWVLYVTLFDERSERPCIATATARDPAGPYTPTAPWRLLCEEDLGGAIDPSLVDDQATGERRLVYKTDGNCCELPTTIRSVALDSTGLRTTSEPVELLRSEEEWERGIVEGPSMAELPDGRAILLYSGGAWASPGYGLGLAVCVGLVGPCERWGTSGQVLALASGAGGAEVSVADVGATIVLHEWVGEPGADGSYRAARIVPLRGVWRRPSAGGEAASARSSVSSSPRPSTPRGAAGPSAA